MYTENLHKKLREITNKNYGLEIQERIGYFDPRVFNFSAVSELLDEIERLNEELDDMKDQNLKNKNIREFYYFENKFPNEGSLVEIAWSDGTSTTENWKENVYSFDPSEVLVIPVRWCKVNE